MESATAKALEQCHVQAPAPRRGCGLGEAGERARRLPGCAKMCGVMARFSHKLAIAPTASISIICGGTSAGIEPIPANIYTHKTLSGSFSVKNPFLERCWRRRQEHAGHLGHSILEERRLGAAPRLPDEQEKLVFQDRLRIDQRWIIELAADRTPYICQGQSLNLFLPGDIDKWDLHMLHWTAWEKGLKSLYYCRSKSIQRAGFAGRKRKK
jgi:ribonucleoside-diphosphate reductase alpha chain